MVYHELQLQDISLLPTVAGHVYNGGVSLDFPRLGVNRHIEVRVASIYIYIYMCTQLELASTRARAKGGALQGLEVGSVESWSFVWRTCRGNRVQKRVYL